MGKIPKSFESEHHYRSSYIYPLLEETRADLCSSLKTIHKAPSAQLLSIEKEPKPKGPKILFNVNLSSWRINNGKGQQQSYRPLPGDIFVILDIDPQTTTDLECSNTWAFAWLGHIIDNNAPTTHLKLYVSKDISAEGDIHQTTTLFIVFLMNVTTNLRIWKALQSSADVGIVKRVLGSTVSFLYLKLRFYSLTILVFCLKIKTSLRNDLIK